MSDSIAKAEARLATLTQSIAESNVKNDDERYAALVNYVTDTIGDARGGGKLSTNIRIKDVTARHLSLLVQLLGTLSYSVSEYDDERGELLVCWSSIQL